MRTILPLIAASACLACASASESHPIDVRFTTLLLPKTDNVDATYRVTYANAGGTAESQSIDPGLRFEVGLVTRLTEFAPGVSLVGGVWAFYGNQESDEVDAGEREVPIMTGPMSYTTLGVDFYLAVAVDFTPNLGMEFGPLVGFGTTTFSDRGVEAGNPDGRVEENGHGDYEEVGLNLQFIARTTSRDVQVSLGVRLMSSVGEASNSFNLYDPDTDTDYPGGLKQDVEIRQNGFAPYLSVGISF
jgi:hypothetical protein